MICESICSYDVTALEFGFDSVGHGTDGTFDNKMDIDFVFAEIGVLFELFVACGAGEGHIRSDNIDDYYGIMVVYFSIFCAQLLNRIVNNHDHGNIRHTNGWWTLAISV
jgi:hypothetical protein